MDKFKWLSPILLIALLVCLVKLQSTGNEPTPASVTEATLHTIFSRKSVRHFSDRPISRAQMDTLTRAAMAAPSSRNIQPWRFILINNRSLLDSLRNNLPTADMLAQTGSAIAICADTLATNTQGQKTTSWMLDGAAATQNLLLAAEAMGLGAVWTGVYPYRDRIATVSRFLSLPPHIIPVSLVPIGYPNGDEQPKDKYNPEYVHLNGW